TVELLDRMLERTGVVELHPNGVRLRAPVSQNRQKHVEWTFARWNSDRGQCLDVEGLGQTSRKLLTRRRRNVRGRWLKRSMFGIEGQSGRLQLFTRQRLRQLVRRRRKEGDAPDAFQRILNTCAHIGDTP